MMDRELYRKKLQGCWLGKNVGGTLGMPMEWERAANDVTYYTHESKGKPLANDDLDIQILWLIALEDKGLHIDAKILGEYFNEFMIFTHAEYGTAKTNLRAGLQPPVTGTFNNEFKDSCGSYIRSEIWACIFPGYPELAAKYAYEDAVVDHGNGEGVYAEVFIAAMESAAFYETDIRRLIEIGLSYIPEKCDLYCCIREAIEAYDKGISWKDSREMIMKDYVGHLEWHGIAVEDAEKGYDQGKMGWDVPSNIMIIVFSLLYGKGDFDKSICTAVHYGEDTDCTAGTIASMFGIMYGTDCMDEKWLKPIGNAIVTVSLDPFRLEKKIPHTIDELAERVEKIHNVAMSEFGLDAKAEDFMAPSYFANIYKDLDVVKYEFPYLTVRLDYCGDPVLKKDESKKIRIILSNNSKSINSDRVKVYLYTRDGYQVMPSNEQAVFLTMAHMGSGMKSIEFEISTENIETNIHYFIAEIRFEENKNSHVMTVPFVLLSESGTVVPVEWERKIKGGKVISMPRI
ncbi:ADP-ribosylglycohydrolase family protein [Blautia liquoris]|uniref:ADP-ribosylglycohydrolase family protein n=1 Tax=Blautia liquoris TaxID=2779518 RepID=A0A7M2RH15_9FIRM|nr:ADP-ribosylglycohydrolase family protein [Blautia liquoris]QOV18837.1 ADP-ribosylglycohydrolase family protein [Blautia liquoris]